MIRSVLATLAVAVAFAWGVYVGVYQAWPFKQLRSAMQVVTVLFQPSEVESKVEMSEYRLVSQTFTGYVKDPKPYYPAISSLADIRRRNEEVFVPRAWVDSAFYRIRLLEASQVERPVDAPAVIRLTYSLHDRDFEAFAYGRVPKRCDGTGRAALVVPGSGDNMSVSIALGDTSNYHHGILEALRAHVDRVFLLVKPNEGIRAMHNGHGRKLDYNYYINWHLNRGGSYTASYVVEAIALSKWIQRCNSVTVIAGLSQGGYAALLVSLQSMPNAAVISSGFSFHFADVEPSGHDQPIGAANHRRLFDQDSLRLMLANGKTSWLFSWGKKDSPFYRFDVATRRSVSALSSIPRVETVVHDGGHAFPFEHIDGFLSRHLPVNEGKQ